MICQPGSSKLPTGDDENPLLREADPRQKETGRVAADKEDKS